MRNLFDPERDEEILEITREAARKLIEQGHPEADVLWWIEEAAPRPHRALQLQAPEPEGLERAPLPVGASVNRRERLGGLARVLRRGRMTEPSLCTLQVLADRY
jgi:hypothetical protein